MLVVHPMASCSTSRELAVSEDVGFIPSTLVQGKVDEEIVGSEGEGLDDVDVSGHGVLVDESLPSPTQGDSLDANPMTDGVWNWTRFPNHWFLRKTSKVGIVPFRLVTHPLGIASLVGIDNVNFKWADSINAHVYRSIKFSFKLKQYSSAVPSGLSFIDAFHACSASLLSDPIYIDQALDGLNGILVFRSGRILIFARFLFYCTTH